MEVAHSWFNRFRRLLIRWEKQAANDLGVVQLAACLIVYLRGPWMTADAVYVREQEKRP